MRAAVFGAGQAGAMVSRWLPSGTEVLCFADNNPALAGTERNGIRVLTMKEMLSLAPDVVFIAVLNREAAGEIRADLVKAGFTGEIADFSEIRRFQDIRLAEMRLLAQRIHEEKIPGCAAELGVYRGEFAAEINRAFPDRELYLFDTFSGFDVRDRKAEEEFTGNAHFRDFSDTDMERVKGRLPHPERAVFVPGYFPESVRTREELVKDGMRYAFVSLDPDLYAPAKAGLEYFWPRMSVGGAILIHDENSLQFPGVHRAVSMFCEANEVHAIPLPDLHGTAVLQKER